MWPVAPPAVSFTMTMTDGSQHSTSQLLLLLFSSLALLATTASADSDAAGLAFLKENKDKEGVVTLASGMQYKVLTKGTGMYHPSVSSSCNCHYSGSLITGEVFDSSYERGEPTAFAPNQVIKGWTEAMQLMVEGDKWEMYIPSDLAYGDRGSPPKIPGNSVLVFQMEILEIRGDDKIMALSCDAETKENCNEKEVAYLTKIGAWDVFKKTKEVSRLEKIAQDPSQVKAELVDWISRRLFILKQVVAGDAEEL